MSSNDGCVVARSNEAKALGIPMAAPAFKYRELFQRQGVVQFSANFDLYGDISRRITNVLTSITPRIEVYSVDESFLDIGALPITDYSGWMRMVRDTIQRWVGVPVSIGVAPTKTLAKLASDIAKKDQSLQGTLDLFHAEQSVLQVYLRSFPIEDIWGVGRKYAPKLRAIGIGSADELRSLHPRYAQQLMGIHGRQMVAELHGTSCYPLEREGKPCQSIASTRTFGHDTKDQNAVEAAMATFVTKASYKLRRSQQLARHATIFLTTNKHKPGYRSWKKEITFSTPTADVGIITTEVTKALRSIWNPQASYHRAGVLLYDFVPAQQLQTDILSTVSVVQYDTSTRRMKAIDSLNDRFGPHTVRIAAENLGDAWRPVYNLRSPRYTTHWGELPVCTITPYAI